MKLRVRIDVGDVSAGTELEANNAEDLKRKLDAFYDAFRTRLTRRAFEKQAKR
jgi:hypothetical protein